MRNTLMFFIVCCLIACVSYVKRPAWVDGGSLKYSEKDYLSASGSADNEEAAKKRALANLARIFEVQIDDTSVDRNYVSVERTNAISEILHTQTTVRYVDAYTSKQLEGAQITELWLDRKSKQYYALAVIPRQNLYERLKVDIAKADAAVNEYMLQSQQTQDLIASANKISMARVALKDREKFHRDLLIVASDVKPIRYRWNDEVLKTQLDSVLNLITVNVTVKPNSPDALLSMLQSAASNAGLKMVAAGQNYSLVGQLEVEDLGLQQGWFWYRGAVQIELIDMQSQKSRGQKRWPIKVSATSREQAEIRLNSSVMILLTQKLRDAIINFNES